MGSEMCIRDRVHYFDPHVSSFEVNGMLLKSVILNKESLKRMDCIVVITDHTAIDYKMVVEAAKIIFDTRNALKKFNSKKIVRL